jgi:putative peptide zinc metalloprotease protein
MINSSENFKEIETFVNEASLIHNEEKYILIYLDKNYYIKKFLFDFLNIIKQENYSSAIQKIKSDNNLSESDLSSLNESVSNTINQIVEKDDTSSYVKYPFTLIKENIVIAISNKLRFLFRDYFLYTLFAVSLLIVGNIFLFDTFNFKLSEVSLNNTPFSIIVILVILLFHELGHSSASAFFKVPPKEIGFGFYIIFPVFFANVSKIWVLKRKDRIIVNFGGIYFQLIANIILFIMLFIFSNHTSFILGIMKINVFVALYSLIPFIRNDGYWVYSDFFDIQNLNKRANVFPYLLYLKVFKKEKREELTLPLAIYSIGNYIFLYMVISKFVFGAPEIFTELMHIFNNNSFYVIISDHFEILFKLLITLFFIYLITKAIVAWCKSFFNLSQKKSNSQIV